MTTLLTVGCSSSGGKMSAELSADSAAHTEPMDISASHTDNGLSFTDRRHHMFCGGDASPSCASVTAPKHDDASSLAPYPTNSLISLSVVNGQSNEHSMSAGVLLNGMQTDQQAETSADNDLVNVVTLSECDCGPSVQKDVANTVPFTVPCHNQTVLPTSSCSNRNVDSMSSCSRPFAGTLFYESDDSKYAVVTLNDFVGKNILQPDIGDSDEQQLVLPRLRCVNVLGRGVENEVELMAALHSTTSHTLVFRCYLCHVAFDGTDSLLTHVNKVHDIVLSTDVLDTLQCKHVSVIVHKPVAADVTISCLCDILTADDSDKVWNKTSTSPHQVIHSGQSNCVPDNSQVSDQPVEMVQLHKEAGVESGLDASWSSGAASEAFCKSEPPHSPSDDCQSSPPLSDCSQSWQLSEPHRELPCTASSDNPPHSTPPRQHTIVKSEQPLSPPPVSLSPFYGDDNEFSSCRRSSDDQIDDMSPSQVAQQDCAGSGKEGRCPSSDDVLSLLRHPLGFIGQPASALHSRNSCKTLKCPKCNWHYKYQETLEIHMKEKHPESDARCVYCLTGRPHPRLARGEVYTCGYKPYRCDVCNYSTTTKGNLSIHMQSDKHLNNVHDMQQSGHSGPSNGPSSLVSSFGNGAGVGLMPPSPPHQSQQQSSPQCLSLPPPMSPVVDSICTSAVAASSSTTTTPPSVAGGVAGDAKMNKPKPVWRCEVCNYETTVARNLRIHMTSEKHTHNMLLVQQQSAKHLSPPSAAAAAAAGFAALGQMALLAAGTDAALMAAAGVSPSRLRMPAFDPTALFLTPPLSAAMDLPPVSTDSEMSTAATAAAAATAALMGASGFDGRHGSMSSSSLSSESGRLFSCVVCDAYSSDLLEELHHHVQLDRSKESGSSVTMFGNTHVCNLCQYKTNLKANFQLHCKTDKHLQRLQYMNHVREGGPANELRHQYASANQPVMQVRCNACDYYANSTHKLQMHVSTAGHDVSARLYRHLTAARSRLHGSMGDSRSPNYVYYHCALCQVSARSRANIIRHVNSSRHTNCERMHLLCLKELGRDKDYVTESVLTVRPYKEGEDTGAKFVEDLGDLADMDGHQRMDSTGVIGDKDKYLSHSFQNFQCGSMEAAQMYDMFKNVTTSGPTGDLVTGDRATHSATGATGSRNVTVACCPLCQETFHGYSNIERHLMNTHNVRKENVTRLLSALDPRWQTLAKEEEGFLAADGVSKQTTLTDSSATSRSLVESSDPSEAIEAHLLQIVEEASMDGIMLTDDNTDNSLQCKGCQQTFDNVSQQEEHQTKCSALLRSGYCNGDKQQQLEAGQQSPSSMKEYRFRCVQCGLAFRAADKLHLHSYYHVIRAATRCVVCGTSCRTVSGMKKHVEAAHMNAMTPEQVEQFGQRVMTAMMTLSLLAQFGQGEEQRQVLSGASQQQTSGESSRTGQKKVRNTSTDLISDTSAETLVTSAVISRPHMLSLSASLDTGRNVQEDSSEVALVRATVSDAPDSDEEKEDKHNATVADHNQNEVDFDCDERNEDDIAQGELANKLALAENSYANPTYKYKCHRCKVAFVKQGSLSAHNKTPMHTKSDKLHTPVDKYLDPARPYKCEICRESFTQRTILLVHYNSVSHLHKVKQQQQHQQQQQQQATSTVDDVSIVDMSRGIKRSLSPAPQSDADRDVNCKMSPREPSKAMHDGTDDEITSSKFDKRSESTMTKSEGYKEFAFVNPMSQSPTALASQGAGRKDKSAAAAPSNTIDKQHAQVSNKDSVKTAFQNGMASSFMPPFTLPLLSASSLLGPTSAADMRQSLAPLLMSPSFPTSTAMLNSSGFDMLALLNEAHWGYADNYLTMMDYNMKITEAIQQQQQQLTQQLASRSASSVLSGDNTCDKCGQEFTSRDTLLLHQKQDCTPTKSKWRIRPQMYRKLIENIGFECVMQFNESVQEKRKTLESDGIKTPTANGEASYNGIRLDEKDAEKVTNGSIKTNLPELDNWPCSQCGKNFSSIWVLKAHEEEVHKRLVPVDIVEECGEVVYGAFERKHSHDSSPVQQQHVDVATPTKKPTSVEKAKVESTIKPITADLSSRQLQQQQQLCQLMQMPAAFAMLPGPSTMSMSSYGLSPSLYPMLPGLGPMDMYGAAAAAAMGLPLVDPTALLMSQQQQQQQLAQKTPTIQPQDQQTQQHTAGQNHSASTSASLNLPCLSGGQFQKRPRTRINDEQLKILRGHFDINNSPSDDRMMDMAEQTGLPVKVIKHWFRNTLFKERQRDKDSPYNFNVPPATKLDLDEFQKVEATSTASEQQALINKPVSDITSGSEAATLVERDSTSNDRIGCRGDSVSYVEDDEDSLMSFDDDSVMMSEPPTPVSFPMSVMGPASHFADMARSQMLNYSRSSQDGQQMDSHAETSLSPQLGKGGAFVKRANRTRFSDFQLRMLQESFEQNAYPKDDEVESLSALLGLSPRVIVVWFQNARQKARKIYENQSSTSGVTESAPLEVTPSEQQSFQCKKCQAHFKYHYELIKHQQSPCVNTGKEIKAEGDCMPLSLKDSSTATVKQPDPSLPVAALEHKVSDLWKLQQQQLQVIQSQFLQQQQQQQQPQLPAQQQPARRASDDSSNDSLAACSSASFSLGRQQLQQHADQESSVSGVDEAASLKRKYNEVEYVDVDEHAGKRMRTTIVPEQLDYLYRQYEIDSNPSRRQLEAIAQHVGLRKRVVQVWFQNTRARERKGLFRSSSQLIRKRCPFCRAIFRAKSALESHLITRHAEEMAKGNVNIDNIPDEPSDALLQAINSNSSSQDSLTGNKTVSAHASWLETCSSPVQCHDSNNQKAAVHTKAVASGNEPSGANTGLTPAEQIAVKCMQQMSLMSMQASMMMMASPPSMPSKPPTTSDSVKHEVIAKRDSEDETPLDLSKPSRSTMPLLSPPSSSMLSKMESSVSMQSVGLAHQRAESPLSNHEQQLSGAFSPVGDSRGFLSNATSPDQSRMMNSANSSTNASLASFGKRYRTQMSSAQIRIMKAIFVYYKMPTMSECETLGREIGLPRRVVQVWFQNQRAKEKKNSLSGEGSTVTEPPVLAPSECNLCHFKYGSKFAIQDHLFSRKHLHALKRSIEGHQTDHQKKDNEARASMVASNWLRPSQSNSNPEKSSARKDSGANDEGATSNSSSALPVMSSGLVSSLPLNFGSISTGLAGASATGTDASSAAAAASLGLLPFMYPTITPTAMGGFLPSLGMPMMTAGFLPDPENMFLYDPLMFGSPLTMLQIPAPAIGEVQRQLTDTSCTLARYTHDCKKPSELKATLSAVDAACFRETTLDVGFICRKCHMVYPMKEACASHQQVSCYRGDKAAVADHRHMIKLEQVLYECTPCQSRINTVQDAKNHCSQPQHKQRLL